MTSTPTPYRTFTNDQGRTFAVRYMPVNSRYGAHGKFVNDHPCVEIYDVTNADDSRGGRGEGGDGFGPLGQFVADYRVTDLLARDRYAGLNMHGDVPVWRIDARTMRQILAWVATLGNTWTDAQREEFAQAYVSAAVLTLSDADKAKLPDTAYPVHQLSSKARDALVTRVGRVYETAASDLATWFHPGHAGWQLWKNGMPGALPAWGRQASDADDGFVYSAYAARVLNQPSSGEATEFTHATARLTVLARGLGTINRLVVEPRDDGLIHLADITH